MSPNLLSTIVSHICEQCQMELVIFLFTAFFFIFSPLLVHRWGKTKVYSPDEKVADFASRKDVVLRDDLLIAGSAASSMHDGSAQSGPDARTLLPSTMYIPVRRARRQPRVHQKTKLGIVEQTPSSYDVLPRLEPVDAENNCAQRKLGDDVRGYAARHTSKGHNELNSQSIYKKAWNSGWRHSTHVQAENWFKWSGRGNQNTWDQWWQKNDAWGGWWKRQKQWNDTASDLNSTSKSHNPSGGAMPEVNRAQCIDAYCSVASIVSVALSQCIDADGETRINPDHHVPLKSTETSGWRAMRAAARRQDDGTSEIRHDCRDEDSQIANEHQVDKCHALDVDDPWFLWNNKRKRQANHTKAPSESFTHKANTSTLGVRLM